MKNALESLESRRLLTTFTVTTNADAGTGSLRDAIMQANATPAADVINFNIGSASKTITLASPLPQVSQPLTIDATTQPGYAGAPIVRVRGTPSTRVLDIDAAQSVVRGLSITDGGTGIYVAKANVTIEKCYIGLDLTGAVAANTNDGIQTNQFSQTANLLSLKSNVISGNLGNGFSLNADNAYIVGNIVGLDPAGNSARGNGQFGLYITGGDNLTIGDAGDANRNILPSATGRACSRASPYRPAHLPNAAEWLTASSPDSSTRNT